MRTSKQFTATENDWIHQYHHQSRADYVVFMIKPCNGQHHESEISCEYKDPCEGYTIDV